MLTINLLKCCHHYTAAVFIFPVSTRMSKIYTRVCVLFTFAGTSAICGHDLLATPKAAKYFLFLKKRHQPATPVSHIVACWSHSSDVLFLIQVVPVLHRQIRRLECKATDQIYSLLKIRPLIGWLPVTC